MVSDGFLHLRDTRNPIPANICLPPAQASQAPSIGQTGLPQESLLTDPMSFASLQHITRIEGLTESYPPFPSPQMTLSLVTGW